jgi:hypothetical protein
LLGTPPAQLPEGQAAGQAPLEAMSISTSDYVDAFKEAVYNPNDSPDGKNLSRSLQVYYADGSHITVDVNSIGNEFTVPIARARSSSQ